MTYWVIFYKLHKIVREQDFYLYTDFKKKKTKRQPTPDNLVLNINFTVIAIYTNMLYKHTTRVMYMSVITTHVNVF